MSGAPGHRCDLLIEFFRNIPAATRESPPYGLTCDRHASGLRATHFGTPTRPIVTSRDILIIEDDAIMRQAMAEWLVAVKYSVRTAVDGTSGLAALQVTQPALVVTDIYMPGTSGLDVIAATQRQYPKIPIIAISGRLSSVHGVDVNTVTALGAARVLAKPIKRRDLVQAVADLLPQPPP